MNYSQFKASDLAADDFFCKWVLSPDIDTDAFWMRWLGSHMELMANVEIARRMVLEIALESDENISEIVIDRMWDNIVARTHEVPLKRPFYFNSWLMPVAACIAFTVIAFTVYRYHFDISHTYTTANGETRRIQLPDGSMVTLNANSKLDVPGGWQRPDHREVWLEGEAFFKVRKQKEDGSLTKFTVHTNDVNVEVKGTEFNVNTRKQQTGVLLSEGKVELFLNKYSQGDEVVHMKPGDQVDFSTKKQTLVIRRIDDPVSVYSWKDNRWTFDKTPLSDVASLITDTYGIKVRIKGEWVSQQKVTGIIPSDNLEDILASLESILHVKIDQQNKEITIKREQ
ncbi:FecR family protein [Dyadobacter sp. 3J3]|uniref:FecR family protein n=1 Tax=Dyadobacter sp. 3J3 TaxID=2606600 RepID=UPI001357C302|nr:FecR domain-containing protein [Dyadobacter sp. 3J3]